MAPLDQYLMADRDAEIALAKSAAPPALSNDASVLVLEKDGYHTAIEGKNGFTCVVERAWMSPLDSTDFWNPKLRGPVCYNPPAVRTILPYTILRTKLILSGLTKDQMVRTSNRRSTASLLPCPKQGAMSYMMSKNQFLGDSNGHWHPHLMFHMPRMGAASWGANLPDSPGCCSTPIIKRGRSRSPSLWCLSIIGPTEPRQCPLIPLCINIDCLRVALELLALTVGSLRFCRKDRAGQGTKETKQNRNGFPMLVPQNNCN